MTPPNSNASGDCGGEFDRLNEFYADLLQPKSAIAQPIFGFIRSKLIQHNLRSWCDEVAVLLWVYLRSVDHIAEGGKITNHSAWVKSVAFNIIRETSRRNKRYQSFDEPLIESLSYHHTLDSDDIDLTDDMIKVRDAFKALSSKEQLLIYQKVVMNESWTTIQDFLKQEGHGDHSLAALRKQKERAMAKLRNIYHSLCEA